VNARYVALGDSQTEGLLDPDGRGGFRGWADRFAQHVSTRDPHLQYANLAVRGLRVGQICETQLAAALALEPDLATVMGGLNDVLHPSFDLDEVLGDLDTMCSALRIAGATVLTNTFPDIAQIAPLFARLGGRIGALNDGIRALAADQGALVVDFARHGAGTDARIWSPDRIHANAIGHSLIAAAFADTFGLPGFANWADPLPHPVAAGALRRTAVEARWLGAVVAPWVGRRLRGRSSGDGRSAKRPGLRPVATLFHLCAPGEW
jgi:lysophospholipase L1-like esterase